MSERTMLQPYIAYYDNSVPVEISEQQAEIIERVEYLTSVTILTHKNIRIT